MKLSEICSYRSERVKSNTLSVENYISTENMLPNKSGVSSASKVPPEAAVLYKKGDILISNIRPYFKKIWQAQFSGGCSSDVLCIRANSRVNQDYLYYLLSQDSFFDYVMSGAKGSKMPRGDKKQIMDWDVELPKMEEQIRIASLLRSIDDKIELNNRINHNLEQQAQALYKSWFIDFEPFKDGKFVESELGMIPEGWRVKKAEEFCDINIGKTPPRKEHQWFSNDSSDITWISISDMGPSGVYISKSSEMLTKEACREFNVIVVPEGTVLLSFKLTIGRVSIAAKELTTNEAIARFLAPTDAISSYLYLALKSYDYGKLGSTSSIATAVNSKIIKGMPLLCPPEYVIEKFGAQVKGMFNLIRTLQNETMSLNEQRDSLLPRLMSVKISC